MKFKRANLVAMLYAGDESVLKRVEGKIIDTSRWSVIYSVVFQDVKTGKYYLSSYSEGATEMQEESAYEYDGDEIECTEVIEKTTEVKQWVPKEKKDDRNTNGN